MDKQLDRRTDRQTDRQTERPTDSGDFIGLSVGWGSNNLMQSFNIKF